MKSVLYLLNIRVEGIKNIKKEVRLDFYKKTVNRDFDSSRYRVKAIYGENGSGKSAIITAVKIFRDLILNSNYLNESKTQAFLDAMINKTTRTFRFGCEFLANYQGTMFVYEYSVCIAQNKEGFFEIKSENLKVRRGSYMNNRYLPVFESRDGELLYVSCGDSQKAILEKKSANVLSSHSFIYVCVMHLNFDEMNPDDALSASLLVSHSAICLCLAALLKIYLGEEDQHDLYFLKRELMGNEAERRILRDKLFPYEDFAKAFSSVNEKRVDKRFFKEYKEKVGRLTQFIKIFKSDLVSIDIDAKENGDTYECDLNLNYGEYSINKEFESTGIKKLIRLFDCFTAASLGGIVFIDEMDSNLNDVYLCRLVEYFMYYGKGQLCFTTHNLDPMSVLKENKYSIDFLSGDNHLVPWISRGNAVPENCYKNGMIEDLPFNIDATDFVGIFGE